jgi:tetratricopeptide (TPR) repeat protein
LRLAIGRQGVGIELARPNAIGCVTVTELTATLPGIRFPVDVSGGVPRFRHRRGTLQTIQIETTARALERWAAPRLRGLVGTRAPEVWIEVRPAGARICVTQAVDAQDDRADVPPAPVVAFDVDLIAERSDLVFVVRQARGTDLPTCATAMAIACVGATLGGLAKRQGAVFVVRDGVKALARALLPNAGARVPATDGVGWTSIAGHDETWILSAAREAFAASPVAEAVRAREIAGMLREGDDALVDGEREKARALYLCVLERAPRHGEIARRLLEIDACTPGRAEAALATLVEARQAGDGMFDLHLGTTPGQLLAEIGDVDAALASFERAGATDPAPPLAASAFELAARLTGDAEEAARWLDRAIARAPRSASSRWLRVVRRLELGRLEDALADVEHLEAQARGARAKHAVWLRAGRLWQSAGQGARSVILFERALRNAPDEHNALAGLGGALVAEGQHARGVAVLARAIDLAEVRQAPATATAPILMELACALAERLDDLPTAIARISAIDPGASEGPVARGLEGRWRLRLGDVAGAALSFARMRELAASLAAEAFPAPPARARNARERTPKRIRILVGLLLEAAALHRSRLEDALGAQRHLAAALRLRPQDVDVRQAYRDVGALVARASYEAQKYPAAPETSSFPDAEEESAVHPATATGRGFALDLALAMDGPTTDEEVQASARAEELTRRLHANPGDDAAAGELASLLELLGRGHELLALLSARLEDAAPERRAVLAPQARAVMARLAEQAEAAGRHDEAALFRGAIENLPTS